MSQMVCAVPSTYLSNARVNVSSFAAANSLSLLPTYSAAAKWASSAAGLASSFTGRDEPTPFTASVTVN